MHASAILTRRHASTLASDAPAQCGAHPRLTALNREVLRRVGQMSLHHDPLHRADTFEALSREFLPRLGEQHESPKAARDPHAHDLDDFNLVVGRNWWDVLTHGPRLLRTFSAGLSMTEAFERGPHLIEANDTFATLLEDPKTRPMALGYAAAVAPRHREALGIQLDAPSLREIESLWTGSDRPSFLTGQAALQLRDYVHHDAGSFNFYRAIDDLHAQFPQLELPQLLENLPAQLTSAARSAWAHPGLRAQAPFYRGLQPHPGIDPAHGINLTPWSIPRPISATMSPAESYLGRCVHDVLYDIELRLHDGPGPNGKLRAVWVAPFQPASKGPDHEVLILPGHKLTLTHSKREDRPIPGGGSFTATIYEWGPQT